MESSYFKYAHVLTVFWISFVVAISFFETPLKFTSPLVTTKIGVSIGMILFSKVNLIEWTIGILMLSFHVRYLIFPSVYLLTVFGLLTLQSFYLLPVLHHRAEALLMNQPLADSFHHHTFVGVEVFKVIFLIFLCIQQVKLYEKRYRQP